MCLINILRDRFFHQLGLESQLQICPLDGRKEPCLGRFPTAASPPACVHVLCAGSLCSTRCGSCSWTSRVKTSENGQTLSTRREKTRCTFFFSCLLQLLSPQFVPCFVSVECIVSDEQKRKCHQQNLWMDYRFDANKIS